MKRLCVIFLAALLFILGACGVPQSDYDAVLSERDQLKTDYDATVSDLNELQSEYDALKEETSDWVAMSETEQAAQIAYAEADRINAEEAQKKAEEEKAAAEAQKQAELEAQKAAEEAARLEEEKKGFNTGITYDQLARTPDDYEGKKVKFKGQVLQVIEGSYEVTLRVATRSSGYGLYYDDVIMVHYSPSILKSRVLEDDMIIVYGVSEGLYTYQSTMGGDITIPIIKVSQIDQL